MKRSGLPLPVTLLSSLSLKTLLMWGGEVSNGLSHIWFVWGPHILALGTAWGKEGGQKLELFPCWSFNVLFNVTHQADPTFPDIKMLVYWQCCTWCCGHARDHGHVSALLIQGNSSKSHFEKAFCPTARPSTMEDIPYCPRHPPPPKYSTWLVVGAQQVLEWTGGQT